MIYRFNIVELSEKTFTCMPDILHPNISAGSKKQPLYRYKEKAHNIRRYRDAYKKHRKCLK